MTHLLSTILKFIIIIVLNMNGYLMAQNSTALLTQIQGDWTCIDKFTPASGNEDVFYLDGLIHSYCTDDIRIQQNQLSLFDLPCEYKTTFTLKNEDEVLSYLTSGTGPKESNYISLHHDTLIISSSTMWSVTSYFIRDTFENNLISQLLTNLINPECLYGTWYLAKEYNSGYDGWGRMPYKFPFAVLDTLLFNEKNIQQYWLGGRKIVLPTRKKFQITQLSSKARILKFKPAFQYKAILSDFDKGYIGNTEPEYLRSWDDE